MAIDLHTLEKKWQKKWADAKVFEPSMDSKRKKYFFTVPYPYTNAPLHVGHGRTYVTADFLARTKRKEGFNVLWPMAFHISGTPILAVSRAIEKGDPKTVGLYKDYIKIYEKDEQKAAAILEGFKDPQNVADFFASVIINDFKCIGLSVDWTRVFNTGEPIYNKFIEWQYLRMKEKGVVVQGNHPMLYSPDLQNAVGEDDIKDGDLSKVALNEFTIIKFLLDGKIMPAATLRPETIFGVTNLWVNPDANYVELEIDGELWIVAEDAVLKLQHQKDNLKKGATLKGKDLVGKEVEVLGMKLPILPATFVDPDNGTGVVMSVPAHAPYDYMALKDLGKLNEVPPVKIIDIQGYKGIPAQEICEKFGVKKQNDDENLEKATQQLYKDEFYSGIMNSSCFQFAKQKVSQAKEPVKEWLASQKMIDVFFETSRKAETRDGGKVIGAILKNQWFLDYTSPAWKAASKQCIENMGFYPEKYRKTMIDAVDWLEKRPCARKRGLGTRLPWDKDWIVESLSDSTIYMAFYTVANIIRRENIPAEKLTPAVFDYVFHGKGEIASLGIAENILNEMRTSFDYWYGVDQRHTAPPHLTNHLTFYVMHHVLLWNDKKFWPASITLNELLIREGAKMSKSKGNVISLVDIPEKYTADLYRLYVLSSTDVEGVVDWKESDVNATRGKLLEFVDLAEKAAAAKPLATEEMDATDAWLVATFYKRYMDAKKHLSENKIRAYCVELFFNMLNDISYYKGRANTPANVSSVIRAILPLWLVSLEPIIPHIAEELWEKLGRQGFVSMEQWPEVTEKDIDLAALQGEAVVSSIVDDIKQVLKIVGKPAKMINVYLAPGWKYKAYDIARNFKDKKTLIPELMKHDDIKQNGQQAAKYAQDLMKKFDMPEKLSVQQEEEIVKSASAFLQKQFNAAVNVRHAEGSTSPKAQRAEPGKPGIELVTE